MQTFLTLSALVTALIGGSLLVGGVFALRRRRLWRGATGGVLALLILSWATLLATAAVAVQGYRALAREDVAARVRLTPAGEQRFVAAFEFADGRKAVFSLSGDALYVDAHILKWRPLGNLLGLHTQYRLDRVAGRYQTIGDAQRKERTVYSLTQRQGPDLFELARRYLLFRPLVDTAYGSATFADVDQEAVYEIRVSASGLLIRRAGG